MNENNRIKLNPDFDLLNDIILDPSNVFEFREITEAK
jgi:hypothetical protein